MHYAYVFLSDVKKFLGFQVESDDDTCPNNEAMLARINDFLNDAHLSSCEGIMVKSLDVDAGYTPSKRSDAWLKVINRNNLTL